MERSPPVRGQVDQEPYDAYDPSFKKHVQRYAKSEDEFFNDFRGAFSKLLELGVPAENFKAFETKLDGGKPFEFATSAEQENAK